MTVSGKIALVANRAGQDNQALLARAAAAWCRRGDRVVGVLAEQLDAVEAACSAGFLRDIASDRLFAIHLEAPPTGTTCHLNADGVEAACAQLLAQIPSSDVVVLSKFGKLEANRQGLWAGFAAAFSAAKPVLTTVSAKHVEAWKALAPFATWLEADDLVLGDWQQSTRSCA